MKGKTFTAAGTTRGPAPDLSVCVPIWKCHAPPNLESLTERLARSLGGLHAELIVVLNGLPPEDVPLTSEMRVVAFDSNEGVPRAWNRAAAAARAPVLCFINDDVLLGPHALRRLWDALERSPDAGVVGPVGTRWNIAEGRHLRYVSLDALPPGAAEECDVLSGFLLCTPRHVFESAGGFDEAYTPCGFEEVDYCTTVRLDLGLKCLAVAGVPFEHTFGISAQRRWRRVRYKDRSEFLGSIARRNRRHFLGKWSDRVSGPQLS